MRILRLVMPAMVAAAVLAPAASAATQQTAKDRFAQEAQGIGTLPQHGLQVAYPVAVGGGRSGHPER